MYTEARIKIGKDRYKYISGDVENGKVSNIQVAQFQPFVIPKEKDPLKKILETQEEKDARKARVQAEIARDHYEKILLNEFSIKEGR